MKYEITCCIVCYKSDKTKLISAIQSFLKCKLNTKLYIIDNSPTDELKELLIDINCDYIFNPSNPGFGSAHNIAIDFAIKHNSKYHLILNPDIYFGENVIEEIYNFMESEKTIGLLMPKILFPNGTKQYLCKNNPTPLDFFIRGFLPKSLKYIFKKRIIKFSNLDKNLDEIIFDIPYLSGCFMFTRVSEFKNVGYFDTRFFLHLEDADLSRRFFNFSRTVYFPKVFCYHHYGGLTHKSFKYKIITIISAIKYFNKWGWT